MFLLTKSDRNLITKAMRMQEGRPGRFPRSYEKMEAALARDDAGGQSQKALDRAVNTAISVLDFS